VCVSDLSADEPTADDYVFVKRESLERKNVWIRDSQKYMDKLLTENTALKEKNGALKAGLESSRKGLFIGGNVGLLLGGDAIVLYQFDRSGIYSFAGYNNGQAIKIGYMRKVR
jgi:hypothetical protein